MESVILSLGYTWRESTQVSQWHAQGYLFFKIINRTGWNSSIKNRKVTGKCFLLIHIVISRNITSPSYRRSFLHVKAISHQCPCPSSSLCSGSSLIKVSILIIEIQASTADFNCRILLMLGSKTPALISSTTLPFNRSNP